MCLQTVVGTCPNWGLHVYICFGIARAANWGAHEMFYAGFAIEILTDDATERSYSAEPQTNQYKTHICIYVENILASQSLMFNFYS